VALFDFVLLLDEGPVFQLDPKLVLVLYEERFDVALGQGVHLHYLYHCISQYNVFDW